MSQQHNPVLSFGEHLKKLRKKNNLTQIKMSEAAGLSKSYISFLESDIRHPSREVVNKLSHIFSTSVQVKNELLIAAGYAPLQDSKLENITNSEHAELPKDFDAFIQHVMHCIRTGKDKLAQQALEKGLQRYNRPAQMQTLLAHLELSRGNFAHAILSQETALKHAELSDKSDNDLIDYRLNLGVMHFLWGDHCLFEKQEQKLAFEKYKQALFHFEQGLKKIPHHVYLLDEAARVHFNLAELCEPLEAEPYWEKAKLYFREALAQSEHHAIRQEQQIESATFLALTYAKTGEFHLASLLLDTLQLTNQGFWLVYYIQCCYYCLRYKSNGNASFLSQAEKAFCRAVELNPDVIEQARMDQDKDLHPLKKNTVFTKILRSHS